MYHTGKCHYMSTIYCICSEFTLKVEITSKSSNTVVHKSEQRVHKSEQSLTKFYTKHNVSFLF